jgi:hypothetical protein
VVVGLAALSVLLASCGSSSDGDNPEDMQAPFELACESFVSIHGDPTESFEGYATPREAVASWIPGSPGGLPQGEWFEHEDNEWVLVDENGDTVGRTEVEVWAGNAMTTFETKRYAAFGVEYCE